jgi:hypothetical protein
MVKRSKKVFKLLITGDYMKEELKKGWNWLQWDKNW